MDRRRSILLSWKCWSIGHKGAGSLLIARTQGQLQKCLITSEAESYKVSEPHGIAHHALSRPNQSQHCFPMQSKSTRMVKFVASAVVCLRVVASTSFTGLSGPVYRNNCPHVIYRRCFLTYMQFAKYEALAEIYRKLSHLVRIHRERRLGVQTRTREKRTRQNKRPGAVLPLPLKSLWALRTHLLWCARNHAQRWCVYPEQLLPPEAQTCFASSVTVIAVVQWCCCWNPKIHWEKIAKNKTFSLSCDDSNAWQTSLSHSADAKAVECASAASSTSLYLKKHCSGTSPLLLQRQW